MQDPRTLAVLQMAVTLIASGSADYVNRSVSEVTAELLGCADGIDVTFGWTIGSEEQQ